MTRHSETRRLNYSAEELYALVADIESYPDFLPWCAAARIRSRQGMESGGEMVLADLVISFKVYREQFGSRVILRPEDRCIDVTYLDGPFRYLVNRWRFVPVDANTTDVEFFVDFQFKSRTLQAVIGAVFNQAMQQVVRAFERRAEALYGGARASARFG